VKSEETKEVVLHLPKRLHPQAIASAWENEFGHSLTDDHILSLDAEGHLTVVRLTPEQYTEIEGKEIILARKRVPTIPHITVHVESEQLRSIRVRDKNPNRSSSSRWGDKRQAVASVCGYVDGDSASGGAKSSGRRGSSAAGFGSRRQ
jgi:hypothetical protein